MSQKRRKNGQSSPGHAAPVADAPRTEGQRLLLAVPGSQAEVAARLEVAKSSVGFWRRGTKTPDAPARAKMRDAYGIDPRAWDQRPGSTPPARPTATETRAPAREPRRKVSTLEEVQVQIDELLELQATADNATIADRLKIIHELNDAYKTRARLEREQELFEDRAVREHPFYLRVKRAILGALKSHPDAARDVVEALTAAGDT